MFPMRSRFLAPLEMLEEPDAPVGGSAASGDTGSKTFTQDEVGKLLSEERKKAADAARQDLQKKIDDARAQEEADRKQAEEEAKGNFEQVKADLKAQAQTAKDEAEQAKGTLKRYQDAINAAYEPAAKAVPEKIMKMYQGKDDDVLAKWEFIHHPATQELIKDLQGETGIGSGGGNGRGPVGNTGSGQKHTFETELAAQRARSRSF